MIWKHLNVNPSEKMKYITSANKQFKSTSFAQYKLWYLGKQYWKNERRKHSANKNSEKGQGLQGSVPTTTEPWSMTVPAELTARQNNSDRSASISYAQKRK